MARARQVAVTLEDVDGSFKRFVETSPKVAKELVRDAINKTTVGVWQRMKAGAPKGPDAPHIKDALDYKLSKEGRKTLTGKVGIFGPKATEPASAGAKGDGSTLAHVALYQEYSTDHHGAQPFMLPAALGEATLFKRRATDALKGLERSFGTTESIRSPGASRVVGGGTGGGLL